MVQRGIFQTEYESIIPSVKAVYRAVLRQKSSIKNTPYIQEGKCFGKYGLNEKEVAIIKHVADRLSNRKYPESLV